MQTFALLFLKITCMWECEIKLIEEKLAENNQKQIEDKTTKVASL